MSDVKGIVFGLLVALIIYILDRYLPKWFGILPGILFLGLIIYLFIFKNINILSLLTVFVIGEAILNGIWLDSLDSRNKKIKRELDKMRAKENNK